MIVSNDNSNTDYIYIDKEKGINTNEYGNYAVKNDNDTFVVFQSI